MNIPDLENMLERVSKVKLPGGVVGKVGYAVIALCIALGSIGAFTKSPWVAALAIIGIVGVTLPLLWRLISFAERNPQAAILEGAEFLVHQQMMIASKNQPQIIDASENSAEAEIVEFTPAEQAQLQQPEAPALPQPVAPEGH